jgi:transcriptional regulator with XRE-family HTH domain
MDKDAKHLLAVKVGRAIARRRVMAGLTQDEVAERLELGWQAVARVERGVVVPTIVRLAELAELFDCRISEFLVEDSIILDDQAALVAQYLAPLETEERQLLVKWVQQFAGKLARR